MESKVIFFSLLEVYVEIHIPDLVPENSDSAHLNMSLLCLKSSTYSLVLKIKPTHHGMTFRSCMIKLPLHVPAQHPGFPLDSPVDSAPFTSAQAAPSTENPPCTHPHSHLATSALPDLSFKVVSSGPCSPALQLPLLPTHPQSNSSFIFHSYLLYKVFPAEGKDSPCLDPHRAFALGLSKHLISEH